MREYITGFFQFVREQGVMGLAIGFVLGGAVTKLVTAFVEDIISPLLGLILGKADNLGNSKIVIGNAQILWGAFVVSFIDFLVIALVVYTAIQILRLETPTKKKVK